MLLKSLLAKIDRSRSHTTPQTSSVLPLSQRMSSSAAKYTPSEEGALTDRAVAADPVDASQVQVEMSGEREDSSASPGATIAASPSPAPNAAAASSSAASSSSSSSPPPRVASSSNVSRPLLSSHPAPCDLLATLHAQITPACHITQPDGNPGSAGNVFVHVIDGVGQFSCSPVDLTYLVLHCQQSRASNYSVIAIMGCQSTGKSTLLNLLFGTKFQEMDSSQGRSQTTKGVWMDSGSQKRDLVVMDLEGTDSGERGEDRTTFERQTSLYALAVAEVLLINMWEHDIGRYTASNYGILKTVFEVNLQLFDTEALNKTVLLFVIRDHIEEETPMAQLRAKLHKEVDKIWAEIRKPAKLEGTPVTQLFELRFCALPHMKLQKALFVEKVTALRNQFVAPSDAEYLFGANKAGRKSVPADGFGVYMEQCWSTIRDNKELNLPTQKEMLATFRCDEIIHTLYADTFTPTLADLKDKAGKEMVADEFRDTCEPLLRSLLASYADETKHYHAAIVASKQRELLRKMSRELEEIFSMQARKFVSKNMIDVFRAELKTALANSAAAAAAAQAASAPGGVGSSSSKKGAASAASSLANVSSSLDAPHPAFAAATAEATKVAMAYAQEQLAKFQLPVLTAQQQETNGASGASDVQASTDAATSSDASSPVSSDPLLSWSALVHKVEEELQAAVESCIVAERGLQLKKLNFHLDKTFKAALSAPLTAILKRANPKTMWADVGKLYRKVRQAIVQQYVLDTLAASYACSAEESAALAEQSESQLTHLCRLIVDQHTGMISLHLRSKFDSLFRYDAEGRIRKWRASDNIRKVFKHARDETLQLLDLFAIFRLDEFKAADSEANKQLAREEEEARLKALAPKHPRLQRTPSSIARGGANATATSPSSAAAGAAGSAEGETKEESEARDRAGSGSTPGGANDDEDDEGADHTDDEKVGQSSIDYSKVDAANIILDPTARLEKESTFRFDIEGALREAELQQAANEEKTKIPTWMIVLAIFLGLDEIMAVLRNPFLLVFLILLGGGAYAAHQVGALWPMISVAKATATQMIAQATAALAPPVAAAPGAAGKARRPSASVKRAPSTLQRASSVSAAAAAADSPASDAATPTSGDESSPVMEAAQPGPAAPATQRGSISQGVKKRVGTKQAE